MNLRTPATWRPRSHFEEDIKRANNIATQAENAGGTDSRTAMDLRLAATAMAVGAMDAYFCDAYVDCLSNTLRAWENGRLSKLPDKVAQTKLPAGAVLDSRHERPGWRLRMAARSLMERENLLDLSRTRKELNAFLPTRHKLWKPVTAWWLDEASPRTLGLNEDDATAARAGDAEAQKDVTKQGLQRLQEIIQLRHNWAHNCGRPIQAIQPLGPLQAKWRIDAIAGMVRVVDDHLRAHRIAP